MATSENFLGARKLPAGFFGKVPVATTVAKTHASLSKSGIGLFIPPALATAPATLATASAGLQAVHARAFEQQAKEREPGITRTPFARLKRGRCQHMLGK